MTDTDKTNEEVDEEIDAQQELMEQRHAWAVIHAGLSMPPKADGRRPMPDKYPNAWKKDGTLQPWSKTSVEMKAALVLHAVASELRAVRQTSGGISLYAYDGKSSWTPNPYKSKRSRERALGPEWLMPAVVAIHGAAGAQQVYDMIPTVLLMPQLSDAYGQELLQPEIIDEADCDPGDWWAHANCVTHLDSDLTVWEAEVIKDMTVETTDPDDTVRTVPLTLTRTTGRRFTPDVLDDEGDTGYEAVLKLGAWWDREWPDPADETLLRRRLARYARGFTDNMMTILNSPTSHGKTTWIVGLESALGGQAISGNEERLTQRDRGSGRQEMLTLAPICFFDEAPKYQMHWSFLKSAISNKRRRDDEKYETDTQYGGEEGGGMAGMVMAANDKDLMRTGVSRTEGGPNRLHIVDVPKPVERSMEWCEKHLGHPEVRQMAESDLAFAEALLARTVADIRRWGLVPITKHDLTPAVKAAQERFLEVNQDALAVALDADGIIDKDQQVSFVAVKRWLVQQGLAEDAQKPTRDEFGNLHTPPITEDSLLKLTVPACGEPRGKAIKDGRQIKAILTDHYGPLKMEGVQRHRWRHGPVRVSGLSGFGLRPEALDGFDDTDEPETDGPPRLPWEA